MLVCTLGDLTLDVVVRVPEALALAGDTDAEIRLVPGGQAANVAAWVAALGGEARLLAKRGDDPAGELVAASLSERGVAVLGPVAGRTAVVCSLVSADGERSMAADRGTASTLQPEEIEAAWLEGCGHLLVSGYALLREPARSAARQAVDVVRAGGATVSVDLASWSALRDAGATEVRGVLEEVAPDAVFANEDEEREIGGPLAGAEWILTRGARGCSFAGDERDAVPVERVVDTTGAGDALAAGYLLGGPNLALGAAARCVQQIGAMPS